MRNKGPRDKYQDEILSRKKHLIHGPLRVYVRTHQLFRCIGSLASDLHLERSGNWDGLVSAHILKLEKSTSGWTDLTECRFETNKTLSREYRKSLSTIESSLSDLVERKVFVTAQFSHKQRVIALTMDAIMSVVHSAYYHAALAMLMQIRKQKSWGELNPIDSRNIAIPYLNWCIGKCPNSTCKRSIQITRLQFDIQNNKVVGHKAGRNNDNDPESPGVINSTSDPESTGVISSSGAHNSPLSWGVTFQVSQYGMFFDPGSSGVTEIRVLSNDPGSSGETPPDDPRSSFSCPPIKGDPRKGIKLKNRNEKEEGEEEKPATPSSSSLSRLGDDKKAGATVVDIKRHLQRHPAWDPLHERSKKQQARADAFDVIIPTGTPAPMIAVKGPASAQESRELKARLLTLFGSAGDRKLLPGRLPNDVFMAASKAVESGHFEVAYSWVQDRLNAYATDTIDKAVKRDFKFNIEEGWKLFLAKFSQEILEKK